jgi:AAHS family 4-hydroxybenzoate transporter-like MFS transporter
MTMTALPDQNQALASVQQRLEGRRISAWQWALVAVIMLVLVIDGLDIQLLALVAPVVIEEWGVSRSEFGLAMSAALVGMAIGAGFGGYLGDRFGKRLVLIVSMIFFGSMTALASLAESVPQMALVRLASGIGFGAAAPTGVALASEWLPRRARAGAAALLSVGTPLGGILGASVVLALLDDIGWRGCFVACGLITLAIVVISLFIVPEAPSRLVARGNQAGLERFFKRIGDQPAVATQATDEESFSLHEVARGSLFERGNRRLNIGSWTLFFGLQFIAYAFAAWSPVFLTVAGFTTSQAVSTTMAFNVCAVGAAVLTSGFLAQWGSRTPLLLATFCAAASILMMSALLGEEVASRSSSELAIAALASGLAGGSTGLGIATIYGLLSYSYPVAYRSTGMGIGMMFGRSGGICIALAGGALLTLDGANTRPFFIVLGILALATIAAAFLIDRHVPRRPAQRARVRAG